MKSAVDVTSSALYRLTIRIRSDDTIRSNMNLLFGALFGTKANTKRIFGTSLVFAASLSAVRRFRRSRKVPSFAFSLCET